jgi:hypothetical protein
MTMRREWSAQLTTDSHINAMRLTCGGRSRSFRISSFAAWPSTGAAAVSQSFGFQTTVATTPAFHPNGALQEDLPH